jgi:S-adenosylmethionine hydrolase
MKQLKEYVSAYIACGGTEEEAIDDIIAKKIMRKLEMQNPVYVRNAIDGLVAFIDETFGEEKLLVTKEYLRHLERTI